MIVDARPFLSISSGLEKTASTSGATVRILASRASASELVAISERYLTESKQKRSSAKRKPTPHSLDADRYKCRAIDPQFEQSWNKVEETTKQRLTGNGDLIGITPITLIRRRRGSWNKPQLALAQLDMLLTYKVIAMKSEVANRNSIKGEKPNLNLELVVGQTLGDDPR